MESVDSVNILFQYLQEMESMHILKHLFRGNMVTTLGF